MLLENIDEVLLAPNPAAYQPHFTPFLQFLQRHRFNYLHS